MIVLKMTTIERTSLDFFGFEPFSDSFCLPEDCAKNYR